jgi:ribonuclease R
VIRPATFNRIIERVGDADFRPQVMEQILRTQTQAYYGPENHGHFGLVAGLLRPLHLADPPLRRPPRPPRPGPRLPLDPGAKETQLTDAEAEAMEVTGELISQHERRAMMAERETMDRYVAAICRNRSARWSTAVSPVSSRSASSPRSRGWAATAWCPSRRSARIFPLRGGRQALVGRG